MKHILSCPAYSNYQPPYEDCTCGADDEPLKMEPTRDDRLEALMPYLQHRPDCRMGKLVSPVPCPECGEAMNVVRDTGGYLNRDQFDAIKAGDWFCKRHEAIVYAWDSSVKKHGCTCGLAALLKAQPACRRVVEQNADDSAAYLSVPCTCGKCK